MMTNLPRNWNESVDEANLWDGWNARLGCLSNQAYGFRGVIDGLMLKQDVK